MSYIYRMKPHPKRVIWAGATLGTVLGISTDCGEAPIGEALDASGLSEMPSLVCGGVDDGLPLPELFQREGESLLGYAPRPGERFPLLVKRLDAEAPLSVQVHPNDAMARYLAGEPNGKAEAWYILDAEEGAEVHLGFREGVSTQDVQDALERGRLLDLMRSLPVEAGDLVPVPAGCAHTIGPGIYLFEVQQTSDLTYRLDDFGRLGEDQRPRTLHVQEGLAAIDLELRPRKASPIILQRDEGGRRDLLVDMGPFSIEKWTVGQNLQPSGGSLVVLHVLDGTLELNCEDDCFHLGEGETVVVAAMAPELSLTSTAGASLLAARHLIAP